MLNRTKLSMLVAAALVAAAGTATAQQRPGDGRFRPQGYQQRDDGAWRHLDRVGTHRHDAEDYINVRTSTPIQSIQLRAEDSSVALDGVIVQYTDGSKERIDMRRQLRAGEAVTVDLPRRGQVKMLILDYGNHGPYWRARETAHVQVLALDGRAQGPGHDRGQHAGRFDGRYRGDRAPAPTVTPDRTRPTQPAPRTQERDRDDWSWWRPGIFQRERR